MSDNNRKYQNGSSLGRRLQTDRRINGEGQTRSSVSSGRRPVARRDIQKKETSVQRIDADNRSLVRIIKDRALVKRRKRIRNGRALKYSVSVTVLTAQCL